MLTIVRTKGLPSPKQMLLLSSSQDVSVEIGDHQVILEVYTNGDGLHTDDNSSIILA
jgi:hypothetical protein